MDVQVTMVFHDLEDQDSLSALRSDLSRYLHREGVPFYMGPSVILAESEGVVLRSSVPLPVPHPE